MYVLNFLVNIRINLRNLNDSVIMTLQLILHLDTGCFIKLLLLENEL